MNICDFLDWYGHCVRLSVHKLGGSGGIGDLRARLTLKYHHRNLRSLNSLVNTLDA